MNEEKYYEELMICEEPEYLMASNQLSSFINYHNITYDDMVNGEGLRVVLWVSGCEHRCKECHNPVTWDPNVGLPFTEWDEAEFWEWLAKPWTQGATFSGGDPLHPRNRKKIGEMIARIKKDYPTKDIWVYTGYKLTENFTLENIKGETFELPYLKDIDVLVDGRFECETRCADIAAHKKVLWRGSSNQRLIDVKASLRAESIIEMEER